MADNNFLEFDVSKNNILSDIEYEELASRQRGFVSGIADSKVFNKVLRQSSVMSAAVAKAMSDNGFDATDESVISLASNLKEYLGSNNVILGEGEPTTSTVGFVGQHYVNTIAVVPPYEYLCISADIVTSQYTWVQVGGGASSNVPKTHFIFQIYEPTGTWSDDIAAGTLPYIDVTFPEPIDMSKYSACKVSFNAEAGIQNYTGSSAGIPTMLDFEFYKNGDLYNSTITISQTLENSVTGRHFAARQELHFAGAGAVMSAGTGDVQIGYYRGSKTDSEFNKFTYGHSSSRQTIKDWLGTSVTLTGIRMELSANSSYAYMLGRCFIEMEFS